MYRNYNLQITSPADAINNVWFFISGNTCAWRLGNIFYFTVQVEHCSGPHSVHRNRQCFRQMGVGQVLQQSYRGECGDHELSTVQTAFPCCHHLPRHHDKENDRRGDPCQVLVSCSWPDAELCHSDRSVHNPVELTRHFPSYFPVWEILNSGSNSHRHMTL